MVPCLLESVNNEERSLAKILSEPKKTSGRNDISQKVASSLSQKFRSRSSLQNIHLSKYYLNICKVDLNSIRDTLFASEDLRERSCDVA